MQSPTYTRVFCEDIKIPAFVSRLPAARGLLPFIITHPARRWFYFRLLTRHAELPGCHHGWRHPRPCSTPRGYKPLGMGKGTGIGSSPGAGSGTRLPPALPAAEAAGERGEMSIFLPTARGGEAGRGAQYIVFIRFFSLGGTRPESQNASSPRSKRSSL